MSVSQRKFENPYRQQSGKLGGVALLGIASAVAGGAELLGPYSLIALIAGIVVGSFASIFWLGWKLAGGSIERHLQAFREGKALVWWTIEAEQWNTFAAEMRSANRVAAAIIAVVLAGCGLLTGWLIANDGDKFGTEIMTWTVPICVVLWLVLHQLLGAAWKSVRHPVEIVYGPGAGVFHGKIISWHTAGYTLRSATLDRDAFRVVVRTEVSHQHGTTVVTYRLPYPPTATEEATELVRQLNTVADPG